jgi:hypothetical protein
MIIQKRVSAVRSLLQAAAARRGTVSFAQLFREFEQGVAPADVYDTLEAACVELADWKIAIYSALLAKANTKLPGDGFFDIFRLHREAEYKRIAGKAHVRDLDDEQRSQMVSSERPRVYAHAGA